MTFQKGNKHGNRFTAAKQPEKKRGKGKLTSIAEKLRDIMLEKKDVKDAAGKVKKMTMADILAHKLVQMAANGNMKALYLIVERMDGKVPEFINHNHEGEIKNPAAAPTQVIIQLNDDGDK